MFDLYLLPLNLVNGQEQPGTPGLVATSAPRRCERARASDLLMIALTLTSTAPYTRLNLDEILQKLVSEYYNSRGTVTAGLRMLVDRINNILLDRNLRYTREAAQVIGSMNLAVLHRETLYLAHCGPTHTYFLSRSQVQEMFDPDSHGRGLGISRTPHIIFYQPAVQPGDMFVFCAKPPPELTTESLKGSAQQSLEQLRRRLLSQTSPEFTAAVIQLRAGNCQLHVLRPLQNKPGMSGEPEVITAAPTAAIQPGRLQPPIEVTPPVPDNLKKPEPPRSDPVSPMDTVSTIGVTPPSIEAPQKLNVPLATTTQNLSRPPSEGTTERTMGVTQPRQAPHVPRSTAPHLPYPLGTEEFSKLSARGISATPATASTQAMQTNNPLVVLPGTPSNIGDKKTSRPDTGTSLQQQDATDAQTGKAVSRTKLRKTSETHDSQWRIKLASTWLAAKRVKAKMARGWRIFLARLIPGNADQPVALSSTVMLFIAIVVPLIVVAVATTIYFNNGRNKQHQLYLAQAKEFTAQAVQQTDPMLKRAGWTQTIFWLDKAEDYGVTDESRALRQSSQQALDQLDGIFRLAFKPAVQGGFADTVNITQMVSSAKDVYLLDSAEGRVRRMILTGTGYEVDNNFICGPDTKVQLKPLVDIITPPVNNFLKAVIMGIDSQGRLAYCFHNDEPQAQKLIPPNGNWGNITGMAFQDNLLYVLDSTSQVLWVYDAEKELAFSKGPTSFFVSVEKTPVLSDIIDFDINGDDVFLLHQDGKMAWCQIDATGNGKHECTNQASYGDGRPGRDARIVAFLDANFTQMVTTQRLDPSIFILDISGPSMYQFSLKLNLTHQYRPATGTASDLPKQLTPTSFAVIPAQEILLAFGNQVYSAPLPGQ